MRYNQVLCRFHRSWAEELMSDSIETIFKDMIIYHDLFYLEC